MDVGARNLDKFDLSVAAGLKLKWLNMAGKESFIKVLLSQMTYDTVTGVHV